MPDTLEITTLGGLEVRRGGEPVTAFESDKVRALLAYLDSLEAPPNPFRNKDGSLSVSATRGQKIFTSSKAGCATCVSLRRVFALSAVNSFLIDHPDRRVKIRSHSSTNA